MKFHWRMPQGGERAGASRALQASLPETGLPDLDAQANFCRAAEECGIDSLLTDFGWTKPDPIVLCTALGLRTSSIKFIVAYRSGLICPTSFVHQINTLSAVIGGRVSINVVAGDSPEEQRAFGDFLDHDERYARTEEFLAVCNGLWDRGSVSFAGRYYRVENAKLNTPFLECGGGATALKAVAAPPHSKPALYIAGNSEQARQLAITEGTCWMQIADDPDRIRERGAAVLKAGKELGVRMSIIGGRTRGEALKNAYDLVRREDGKAETEFVRNSDSINVNTTANKDEWLRPWLWTGAVKTHGTPSIALVGSPTDIAEGIDAYHRAGVTQFILSGWPKLDSMLFFAHEVVPLLECGGKAAAFEHERVATVLT